MRSTTFLQARWRGGLLLSAARHVIGLLRGCGEHSPPRAVPYEHSEIVNGVEIEPREVQYPHPDSIPKLPQSIFHTER
jgi:hypothetical protein